MTIHRIRLKARAGGVAGFLFLLASRQALADPLVCRDLFVRVGAACCATEAGTACASAFYSPQSVEKALSKSQPKPLAVRKIVLVESGVCVLNEDRRVVCWPDIDTAFGRRGSWTAPGIQASDLAAATSGVVGTAFCVNAVGQGVRCYRALGPVPHFLGKIDIELESLMVNDAEVCGLARGVPQCFRIPQEKSAGGVLTAEEPWAGFDASSPAVAMAGNRDHDVCAVRGSQVTCNANDYVKRRTLPAPAVGLAVGWRTACAVLEGRVTIACWHPQSHEEEVKVTPLREGSGAIEGVVGTDEGVCFLRTGGLVCLVDRQLFPRPAEPPPAAVAATKPTKPPPSSLTPTKPSNGGSRDDRKLSGYAAVPFSFGHGAYKSSNGSASGLWLRLRAIVAIGEEGTFRRRGWALGPYFEVAWHPVTGQDRMASFGAGATGIWAITRGFGVIPSVGWYSQEYPGSKTEHGVSAGLFVGAIQDAFGPLPLPIGIRIETRAGFGDQRERSILFGGEVDAIIGGAIPVFLIMWAGSSYNWT